MQINKTSLEMQPDRMNLTRVSIFSNSFALIGSKEFIERKTYIGCLILDYSHNYNVVVFFNQVPLFQNCVKKLNFLKIA